MAVPKASETTEINEVRSGSFDKGYINLFQPQVNKKQRTNDGRKSTEVTKDYGIKRNIPFELKGKPIEIETTT